MMEPGLYRLESPVTVTIQPGTLMSIDPEGPAPVVVGGIDLSMAEEMLDAGDLEFHCVFSEETAAVEPVAPRKRYHAPRLRLLQ